MLFLSLHCCGLFLFACIGSLERCEVSYVTVVDSSGRFLGALERRGCQAIFGQVRSVFVRHDQEGIAGEKLPSARL